MHNGLPVPAPGCGEGVAPVSKQERTAGSDRRLEDSSSFPGKTHTFALHGLSGPAESHLSVKLCELLSPSMDPESCAKRVIQESLKLHGSIDDDELLEIVAQACGKSSSVSLSATSSSQLGRSGRKASVDLPRRSYASASRSMSLDLPRGTLEHRTSRPKSAKQNEQTLFKGLRRQVADAATVAEPEETILEIEEALNDGALRIPRETARLNGLIKKADSRLAKDPNLAE